MHIATASQKQHFHDTFAQPIKEGKHAVGYIISKAALSCHL